MISKKIDDLGGDDWFFDHIIDGKKMQWIADQLGCSRPLLYRWLDEKDHRREALKEARKLAAHTHVEDADASFDDLDLTTVTSAQVQMVTSRANYKKWLASCSNREEYGTDKVGVQVNLSVGDLHLDALRVKGGPPPVAEVMPVEVAGEIEGEVHDSVSKSGWGKDLDQTEGRPSYG
jgi:hypothetical protein